MERRDKQGIYTSFSSQDWLEYLCFLPILAENEEDKEFLLVARRIIQKTPYHTVVWDLPRCLTLAWKGPDCEGGNIVHLFDITACHIAQWEVPTEIFSGPDPKQTMVAYMRTIVTTSGYPEGKE